MFLLAAEAKMHVQVEEHTYLGGQKGGLLQNDKCCKSLGCLLAQQLVASPQMGNQPFSETCGMFGESSRFQGYAVMCVSYIIVRALPCNVDLAPIQRR